jgi:hypothetical protein
MLVISVQREREKERERHKSSTGGHRAEASRCLAAKL